MGIWNILKQNLAKGSRTRAPKDSVPHPESFRGQLQHEAARCTACQTCAYVCSPSAITFEEDRPRTATWQYFAGQCTFCGRCVAFCPTGALRFDPQSMPITGKLSDLRTAHVIEYVPCARCGEPFIPLPGPVLVKMYGDPLPPDIIATRYFCEECRNRTATRNLKEAARGQLARRASDQIDPHGVR